MQCFLTYCLVFYCFLSELSFYICSYVYTSYTRLIPSVCITARELKAERIAPLKSEIFFYPAPSANSLLSQATNTNHIKASNKTHLVIMASFSRKTCHRTPPPSRCTHTHFKVHVQYVRYTDGEYWPGPLGRSRPKSRLKIDGWFALHMMSATKHRAETI